MCTGSRGKARRWSGGRWIYLTGNSRQGGVSALLSGKSSVDGGFRIERRETYGVGYPFTLGICGQRCGLTSGCRGCWCPY